jgi:hypothetical protein
MGRSCPSVCFHAVVFKMIGIDISEIKIFGGHSYGEFNFAMFVQTNTYRMSSNKYLPYVMFRFGFCIQRSVRKLIFLFRLNNFVIVYLFIFY